MTTRIYPSAIHAWFSNLKRTVLGRANWLLAWLFDSPALPTCFCRPCCWARAAQRWRRAH